MTSRLRGPGGLRLAALLVPALAAALPAQTREVNYDEGRVGSWPLSDPLLLKSGQRVADAKTWIKKQRPATLRLFETQVYGAAPERCAGRPRTPKLEPQGLTGPTPARSMRSPRWLRHA